MEEFTYPSPESFTKLLAPSTLERYSLIRLMTDINQTNQVYKNTTSNSLKNALHKNAPPVLPRSQEPVAAAGAVSLCPSNVAEVLFFSSPRPCLALQWVHVLAQPQSILKEDATQHLRLGPRSCPAPH